MQTSDYTCDSVMKFPNIPLDYYYCSVAVYYRYFDDNDDFRYSPDTKETCTYNESKIIIFNYVCSYYAKQKQPGAVKNRRGQAK